MHAGICNLGHQYNDHRMANRPPAVNISVRVRETLSGWYFISVGKTPNVN